MIKDRDYSIDVMKTICVLGMILNHIYKLLILEEKTKICNVLSSYGSLIHFSGFMFCFGYLMNKLSVKSINLNKKLKTATKILLSFYVSAIFFRLLVNPKILSIKGILKILLLFDIPGYSEFLITYVIQIVIYYVFSTKIIAITNSKNWWLLLICPLFFTFTPYHLIEEPHIAILIGTTKFATFPAFQYFYLFFLGWFVSAEKIRINWLLITSSSIVIILFTFKYIILRSIPSRFPPSLLWILSATLPVIIYYKFSSFISTYLHDKVLTVFSNISGNSLVFLILSNVIIFSLKRNGAYPLYTLAPLLLFITSTIYYINASTRKIQGANSRC